MSEGSCIFCEAFQNPANDEKNFVLHRGAHNFIILNLYPYISGHLMIAQERAPWRISDQPRKKQLTS